MKFVNVCIKKCMLVFSVGALMAMSMAGTQCFAQESTMVQGDSNEAEAQSYGYCFKCTYYCGLHGNPLVYSCEQVCRYDWFMDCD